MSTDSNVLLFVGSPRTGSHTRSLVDYVSDQIIERGGTTSIWDPLEMPLAHADPQFHWDATHNPDDNTRILAEWADKCNAMVWSSPVYHNSYSAILKNALDALPMPVFAQKPIGLLGHGGGRTTQAVDHLRIVARGTNAIAITTQVCTRKEDYEEAENGFVLTDLDMHARVSRFVDELFGFIPAMAKMRNS